MTVLNEGSVITNGSSIFTSGSASILLTNNGTLQGEVNCISASGNDFIVNRGTITGTVGLGAGDDEFDGRGGSVSGDILGGAGEDTIIGGKGGDEFWGGGDLDIFKFVSVKETGKGANRDVIMDFGDVVGEKIDLIDIDAKKGPGNQDFKFIGAQKFHDKAGELRMLNKSGFVLIEGDVNGDGKADFQIEVHGIGLPDKGDLLGVL
jgi:Ca2+-binding RTX toxin-like protein